MKIPNDNERLILALQAWTEHYSNRNLNGLLDLFCKNHPLLLIGTGTDEKIHSIEELKKQFARDWEQSESIDIQLRDIKSYIINDIAWISADSKITANVSGKTRIYPSVRNTHMLIKENGNWLFTLSHWSTPTASQALGNSFPE